MKIIFIKTLSWKDQVTMFNLILKHKDQELMGNMSNLDKYGIRQGSRWGNQ